MAKVYVRLSNPSEGRTYTKYYVKAGGKLVDVIEKSEVEEENETMIEDETMITEGYMGDSYKTDREKDLDQEIQELETEDPMTEQPQPGKIDDVTIVEGEVMTDVEVKDHDSDRIMRHNTRKSSAIQRDVISYLDGLSDERKQQAFDKTSDIDINRPLSITNFSQSSQKRLKEITGVMLNGVKNRDIGEVGETISQTLMTVKGLDATSLSQKSGWLAKILKKSTPIIGFIENYKGVQNNIDTLVDSLDDQRNTLEKNVIQFDDLYDSLIEYYDELTVNMQAIRLKIEEVRDTVLNDYIEQAKKTNDPIDVQKVQDCEAAIDMLERKFSNLAKSRAITMQSLPTIKTMNDNNLNLIQRLSDIIVHTVPAWQNSLAIAIGMYDQQESSKIANEVTDMTNDLITQTSAALRTGNVEIRKQIEQGVVDVSAITTATENIIATLEETNKITEEGRAYRSQALEQLDESERKLQDAIVNSAEETLKGIKNAKKTRRLNMLPLSETTG